MTAFYKLPSDQLPVLLIICVLSLSSLLAFSQDQEIQGRIFDESNNEPVSFANVYTHDGKGVTSDETGFFRYHINEGQSSDSLYFSCIGYASVSVAFSDLEKHALDSIFMAPRLFRLDEVQVESKKGKTPKSKQIIKTAIAAIPENHPDFPVKYRGYYREYIKQEEDNINLFESIIELSDSGINHRDNFAAGLLFKRSSPDFEVNPGLMRPYDNVNKFIPYMLAPNTTANELVLLRSHDPIRNFDQATLYHIDNLESKFIKNHEFFAPRITYLDDVAYYSISFINKKPIKKGTKLLATEGTIFINTSDYGIKKLTYAGFAREGDQWLKLFGLNLEYELEEQNYYLNYLSFNNLFMTRNFSMSDAHVHGSIVDMTFNQDFDTTALRQEDFRVFWKDRELEVNNMVVALDSNIIRLTVSGTEDILSEYSKQNSDLNNPEEDLVFKGDEFISKHLSFEIVNMTDLNGNPLEKAGFREYYQYRELFVRDFQTENTLISNNLIDQQKPVFGTRIFGEMSTDTSWINTPLIADNFDSELVYLENEAHRNGIRNLLSRNGNTVNEMVYLHTDREVYAPSDTLWFKAYIREMEKLDTSSLSQTLFVKIVNEKGGKIEQARYLIEHSNAKGQFILDQELEEGIYYLIAYSSWMQNYDLDQLRVKKILVRNERRPQLQMELVLDRSVYFAGDTIRAVVHCYDEQNRDVDNVKYQYSVEAGKKKNISSGRARTTETQQDTLKFVIPGQASEQASFSIKGTHRGQVIDTLYRLPVIRDIHIDFFPEGGNSIQGLESRVAFKAQTLQGDPIHIQGEIVDQEGRQIKKVASEHDGMGAFTIAPSNDQPLFMKMSDPPGFDSLYALPQGLDHGWQMGGKVEANEIILEVQRQDTPGDQALITLMVRGHLSYYQQVQVKKRKRIQIPLDDIPAGIGVVTLFDHNMDPRAERLFYINHAGEPEVQMESSHRSYVPRDKVRLEIDISSDLSENLTGSYSLSVVDDQLGNTEFIQEPNIRSAFLLSPEIKGKINNPNYYMDIHRPGVRSKLDLLLLTQGWRNYSYLKEINWEEQMQKPRNQEIISGILLRQPFGKEMETTAGHINVYYGGSSIYIPVNENGRFAFNPEYDLKYNSGILISGVSDPPSNHAILQVDEPEFRTNLPDYLKTLTDSIKKATNIPLLPYRSISDQFSLSLTYFQWIEEVEIVKTRNRIDDESYDAIIEDFIVMNKRESGPEDIEGAIDLIGILYNMGIPIEYKPESDIILHLGYPRAVITFVVDGSVYGTNFSFVQNFVPASIDKVFLVKGVETMYYGPNMTEVVVSIKLKTFDSNSEFFDPYISKYWVPPFKPSKEFYTPLYDSQEKRKSQIPDLRKTIHWDPDLKIGTDGSSTVVFYNGDRYTKVKCVLEGITHEGVPVYQEYYYNVSLSRD